MFFFMSTLTLLLAMTLNSAPPCPDLVQEDNFNLENKITSDLRDLEEDAAHLSTQVCGGERCGGWGGNKVENEHGVKWSLVEPMPCGTHSSDSSLKHSPCFPD